MLTRQSFFYSFVLVPPQIVNINNIYTILYLPEGVHIWYNNWLLCVTYNIGLRSDHRFDLGLEVQGQIYLQSICLMAYTNSSFMFWLLCVNYNIGLRSDHRFDLGLEVRVMWYAIALVVQSRLSDK